MSCDNIDGCEGVRKKIRKSNIPMTRTAKFPFHRGLRIPAIGSKTPRIGSRGPQVCACCLVASLAALAAAAAASSLATSPLLRRPFPLPPTLEAARARGATAALSALMRSLPNVP